MLREETRVSWLLSALFSGFKKEKLSLTGHFGQTSGVNLGLQCSLRLLTLLSSPALRGANYMYSQYSN